MIWTPANNIRRARMAGVLTAACLLLAAPADAQTSRPARTAADEPAGLLVAMGKALADGLDDDDLEVRTRASAGLRDLLDLVAFHRVRMQLPPHLRTRLVRLARRERALLDDALSSDPARRLAAAKTLDRRIDPDALAEPLLVLLLGDTHHEVRTWAAHASARQYFRHPLLAERLGELMLDEISRSGRNLTYRIRRARQDDSKMEPALAAIEALRTIHAPNRTAVLTRILDKLHGGDTEAQVEVALAIAEAAEPEQVDYLLKKLSDRSSRSLSVNGLRTTCAKSDAYLLAMLTITGQSTEDYGLILQTAPNTTLLMFGFANNQDRARANQRFREFWKARAGEFKQPAATVENDPRAHPPAGGGNTPSNAPEPPADRQAVLARARALLASLPGGLGHPRSARREQVQQAILETQEQLLEMLAEDDDPQPRADAQLQQLRRQARAALFLYNLPEQQQQGLKRLRERNPEGFAQAFSDDAPTRDRGLRAITDNDPDAQAEPLLVSALASPDPGLRTTALRLAATGRYRNPPVVRALANLLARLRAQRGRDGNHYGITAPSASTPHARAVTALGKTRSPHAVEPLVELLQHNDGLRFHAAEALVTLGLPEKVRPRLLPMLENTNVFARYRSGKTQRTFATADAPLWVLIRLADADPKQYGFVYWHKKSGNVDYGFESEADRKHAIEKFRILMKKRQKREPGSSPTTAPAEGA